MSAHLPAHFYVHVPFCASKCAYCDFASYAGCSEEMAEAVFSAMRTQIIGWERSGIDGVVETVYFGGGTPSLHATRVVTLLAHIRRALCVHPGAEITVEGNPDSLTDDVVDVLARAGVTRVSVGIQSFDDRELKILGRRHDAREAERACARVLAAGMALSVDLMCALPGQSRASLAGSIAAAAETGARHMSVYPLTIEDGTALQVAVDNGLVPDVDPDTAAEMMVLAEQALAFHGYERYEIANYAMSRRDRSRHNTAYWTGRSYAGIGPGAHGMLDVQTARATHMFDELSDQVARVRYGNAPDLDDWITGKGDSIELLDADEAAREDAMLGMRLVDGISDELVARAGALDALVALESSGLVLHEAGRWRCTRRGWLLGNEVFERIWLR